jgi:hypothetical protein
MGAGSEGSRGRPRGNQETTSGLTGAARARPEPSSGAFAIRNLWGLYANSRALAGVENLKA